MKDLQLFKKNNETILTISFFDPQRREQVGWNKKVMVDHFNIPVNYIECPFPDVSHGQMMNLLLKETVDLPQAPDYYWFLDCDAIILKKECVDIMYDMVKNKMTLAGQIWQSNHKKGPNGMIPHPYVSQAFIWLSRRLYDDLGRPDCDHFIPRSDTAEELTYLAKEKGYCVAGFYPSNVVDANTDLDNGCKFGLGNTYGPNLMYHCSQFPNPKHEELFVQKCKEVLEGKYD